MITKQIGEISDCFVKQLLPKQVYLFGSYANDTYTASSDLDFYIVVHDDVQDIAKETMKAYKAIRQVKRCPVDIVVGTSSRFEERKGLFTIEGEVHRKGILLYDERSGNLV